MASAMPATKLGTVSQAAPSQVLDDTTWPISSSTALSGGKRKTRPVRPTISQTSAQKISEVIIGILIPNSVMAPYSAYCLRPCQISSTTSR